MQLPVISHAQRRYARLAFRGARTSHGEGAAIVVRPGLGNRRISQTPPWMAEALAAGLRGCAEVVKLPGVGQNDLFSEPTVWRRVHSFWGSSEERDDDSPGVSWPERGNDGGPSQRMVCDEFYEIGSIGSFGTRKGAR